MTQWYCRNLLGMADHLDLQFLDTVVSTLHMAEYSVEHTIKSIYDEKHLLLQKTRQSLVSLNKNRSLLGFRFSSCAGSFATFRKVETWYNPVRFIQDVGIVFRLLIQLDDNAILDSLDFLSGWISSLTEEEWNIMWSSCFARFCSVSMMLSMRNDLPKPFKWSAIKIISIYVPKLTYHHLL